MTRNFKPIEFDGSKGYEFETYKTDNHNFNYPEFEVIKKSRRDVMIIEPNINKQQNPEGVK